MIKRKKNRMRGSGLFSHLCSSTLMFLWPAILLAQSPVEIGGVVNNGTTGKPVIGQRILLLSPSKGMEEVSSAVTDGEGRFQFEKVAGPFFVVQTRYQGANYNHPVRPQERGLTTTTLTVYDATPSDTDVAVTRAQWRLLPDSGKLQIDEIFEITNNTTPPRTFVRGDGTFKFNVPAGATVEQASVQGSAGMPLPQTPREITPGKQFALDHPLLPGVTQIALRMQADYASQAFDFSQTLAHEIGELDFFLPKDMQVKAAPGSSRDVPVGFEPAPETQGYQVLVARGKRRGDTIALRVLGGSVPTANAAGGPEKSGEEPEVKTLPNAIGVIQIPLVGLFALIVLWSLGFAVFHRTELSRKTAGLSAERRKALGEQKDYLVRRLVELDARFEKQEIAERDYRLQRRRLRSKCVELMRQLQPAGARKREKTVA